MQDESLRIQALLHYAILDTPAESGFDDITLLAAQICETPIAIITLLDQKRQWFKSKLGIEISETPREIAFCAYTILGKELYVVEDATKDPVFLNNPMVTGDPHIRFYAGAPLIMPEGYVLGTLSVIDRIPRLLNTEQRRALQALSRNVVLLLEMKRNMTKLARTMEERNQAEYALRQSKNELEQKVEERTSDLLREVDAKIKERDLSDALINSLPGIFYVFDEHGKFLRWNGNFLTVTGYNDEEMQKAHPLDFFASDEEKQLIAQKIQEVFEDGSVSVESRLITKDGTRVPYLFNGNRIQVEGIVCTCGMGVDITDRKKFETSLIESQERYRQLIELSPNAVFVVKASSCVFANQAAVELIGAVSVEDILSVSFDNFVHPDYHEVELERKHLLDKGIVHLPRIEEQFVRLDGSVIDVEVAMATFSDNGEPVRLVLAHDITKAKRYKQQLERHANYDELTHLANRNLLSDRISQSIAIACRHRTHCAVGFVDLDNFKLVNDTLGHDIGDQLLIAAGRCLKSCVREEDTVARYGGDEFVLVFNECTDEESLKASIKRLIERMSRPFSICGHQIYATCSIGLSMYPKDGTDQRTLLKHADTAMYQAKAAGRNQFKFYTASMNQHVKARFDLETKLRQALERNEFVLHYQPQMDLQTGKVIGMEALIRWNCAGEGFVSPDRFISIAEDTGLIIPIGEWVIQQACRDNRALQQAGLQRVSVSVNISARQLDPCNLVKTVENALREAELSPNYLKLEITETAIMGHPEEAQGIFRNLNDFGVRFAIDDFGIGYSSLSYLQRFPMEQLKIDQSFIQHVTDRSGDAAIAQAVISLGHNLGMSVIAEGVSSASQVEFLRERCCDAIQGFYFSKPLPLSELQSLLRTNQ